MDDIQNRDSYTPNKIIYFPMKMPPYLFLCSWVHVFWYIENVHILNEADRSGRAV
jgi:hypothetical protein